MPTGYTSDIYDGKDTSFAGYVWRCARAFGALVTMRDEGLDAEIPSELKPSDYHQKRLAEELDELGRLESMTDAELEDLEKAERKKHEEGRARAREEAKLREARYAAVLAEAKHWSPPTPDHKKLKEFMVSQIEESMRFDCLSYNVQYKPRTRAERISKARSNVEYHKRELQEETERVASRNAWLKALRESVPYPRVTTP